MEITSYFTENSVAACKDCGMAYEDFPLDLVLLDEQWLMIHPEGLHGLLCASCILKRASKLDGCTVIFANLFERDKNEQTTDS